MTKFIITERREATEMPHKTSDLTLIDFLGKIVIEDNVYATKTIEDLKML